MVGLEGMLVFWLVPKGFYFGQRHSVGLIEYTLPQARQTEYDVIVFGIQTVSTTAQVLRIESELKFYSLEYEIVRSISVDSPLNRVGSRCVGDPISSCISVKNNRMSIRR